MDSVVYICCLLLITIFVFGVVGVALFSENNPSAFGGLSIAILTLFQCSTLSNWHYLYYTEMHGCDQFGNFKAANSAGIIETELGWFFDFDCVSPQAQPVTATLFFVLFTGISSFVVLSLIVGTVTLGMVEAVSMVQDIVDIQEAHDRHRKRTTHTWMKLPPPSRGNNFLYGESEETMKLMGEEEESVSIADESYLRIVARSIALTKHNKAIGNETISETIKRTTQANIANNEFKSNRSVSSFLRPVAEPFSSEYFYDDEEKKPHSGCWEYLPKSFVNGYLYFSYCCSAIVSTRLFEGTMMTLIVLMAILIGLEASFPDFNMFKALQNFIIWIFALEVILKFGSEGRACQQYFYNAWNAFDFIVTLIAFISLFELGSFNVSIFRLFRLMQLMRSLSKIVTLRIIVECLTRAVRPMRYIAIIFVVFNYLFGVLGVVLFQRNDPFHFGSLRKALLTIYRVETRQNWEKVMYLNMYGCDKYNAQFEGAAVQHCPSSTALGWIAAFYFITVVVIGAILLPTLLIALITSCMSIAAEMVNRELRTLKMMHEEIRKYPEFYSTNRVKLLVSLYDHVDVDNSGTLTFEEIYPLLKVVDDIFYEKPEAAEQLFLVVDDDSSGEIEMSEFMHLFRNINRASNKVQEKTQNAQRIRIEKEEEVKEEVLGKTPERQGLLKDDKTPSFMIPDEFMQNVTKESSFSGAAEGSFVVNDDHLIVRELAARAISRMILGDPNNLTSLLDGDSLLDDEKREAIINMFQEAAVKVHKPLISHRGGDTLHQTLEDEVKMQVGLGVCEKRDLPYAMSLVALGVKIDGTMWRDGAVRSPHQVNQLALEAEEALQLLQDRQDSINYLNKEAKMTGYQACEGIGSEHHLGKSQIHHTISEKEQVVTMMLSEDRTSMENLKKYLKWDGFEQWERKVSLEVTHLQPSAKHELKEQSVIEFSQLKDFELPTMAHDEGGVFARRPGWCVLAGQSAVRQFRRSVVSKLCGTARRKVVKCLMERGEEKDQNMDFETIQNLFKEMVSKSGGVELEQTSKDDFCIDHNTFTHYLKLLMKKRNKDNKLELTEEEIGAVLLSVDTDCDGVISFKEFQNFLNSADDLLSLVREVLVKFSLTPYGMPDLKAAFYYFDKNGSGVLEVDEFRSSIFSLGYDISEFEVTRLMASVHDGKGYVNYDDFVAMFFGTNDLIIQVQKAFEHLAVYGAPASYGGGSGVQLFHRVIDELPRSHDAFSFIKALAKMRSLQKNGTYIDMKEEDSEMDNDIVVSWAVLENALLIKLPLGLKPLDVKKVLMLVDLTGSGHCSLLLFESIFFKFSALLEKMRLEFRERCHNASHAVHPQVKMLSVAHKEGFHSDVPSLLLTQNSDFFATMLHPTTTLSESEAHILLYLTESSMGMVHLPTLAHLVTDVYDITASIATARVLRRYRGFLDVPPPYPIESVEKMLLNLDRDLECELKVDKEGDAALKAMVMASFQPYQSEGHIAPRDFPSVLKKLLVTYRNHSRAGYDNIRGKRKFFGECALETSALMTCALTSSKLKLLPSLTAVVDEVEPPRLKLTSLEVNRLMAFLGDTEDGGGVSVERLISWLEELETLTEKLLCQIEEVYEKFDAYNLEDQNEALGDGLKMEASVVKGEVVEVSPRCALLGREGSAFKDHGNYEEAVRVYKEKLDIEPASQHGLTFFMIGEIYCKQERWCEANDIFLDAVKCDPHLEFEFEVQMAADEVGKAAEMLRKATLELSLPLQPLYKTRVGEKAAYSGRSNTLSMFKQFLGRKPVISHDEKRDAAYEEQAKIAREGGERVKELLKEKRTVWCMKYGGRVMELDLGAKALSESMTMGRIPCFEESVGGCSLVFSAGAIHMIVLEKEKQGTKVTGVAKGDSLVIKKASRHLGDTATQVEFTVKFDQERVVKYKGYIEPGTPKLLQGVMLEVVSDQVLQSVKDTISTKAAYSSALIYMNKGSETSPVVVEVADEDHSMHVKLLAVKSLTRKSEGESRRLYATATLCSKLPITSQEKLTASSPAWGGEDLYNDVSLPSTYLQDPYLRLKVMNEKSDYRKECVGEVEICLKDLTANIRTDKWFQLHAPGSNGEEGVGEIRLILQKGEVLKKKSNLQDEEEGATPLLVDGTLKHLNKKFGHGEEMVREGGVAYLKLGTFLAEMAEFAFHSDDRYGILRAPFVVRTLGRTLSRSLSRRSHSESSFSKSKRPSSSLSPANKQVIGKEPILPPPSLSLSQPKPKKATLVESRGSAQPPPSSSSPVMMNNAREGGFSSETDPKIGLLVRFLGKLAVNKNAMQDMLKTLPQDVRHFINSRDFTDDCQRKFAALCQPGQRSIPIESMMPILNQFSEGSMRGQTSELCSRFMRVFDEDRDGFIDSTEFLEINRFFFMVSCLEADLTPSNASKDQGQEFREVRQSYEDYVMGPSLNQLQDLDMVLLTATQAHGFTQGVFQEPSIEMTGVNSVQHQENRRGGGHTDTVL